MVVGQGMLAKMFNSYENNLKVIIFASGVSNSKEVSPTEFKREQKLLLRKIDENKNRLFVYFSTCSIEDSFLQNSNYVLHKIEMEKIIKKKCSFFYIFRLPQVVGNTNSPTLVNFLTMSIKDNKHFMIQKNATRNLIDVEDVFKIIDVIIRKKLFLNSITNIASPYSFSVVEIVSIIEKILNKKADFELVEGGGRQNIDLTKLKSMNNNFDIFNSKHTESILQKYLKNQEKTSLGSLIVSEKKNEY